jgi:hypothetical protein
LQARRALVEVPFDLLAALVGQLTVDELIETFDRLTAVCSPISGLHLFLPSPF